MSLPDSSTKNCGRLPQPLRPLLPAPSPGQDQPTASTASLLQSAEQPPRTEPELDPVLTIASALSQEEQSQISLDFDPLPPGIDLNFDRPYYSLDTTSTSSTSAPVPAPQPVDPALSFSDIHLPDAPRGPSVKDYLFKEPCPFTGNPRGAPQAVSEAQTSSTPPIVANSSGQTTHPTQPPAPFSHGYRYPTPPIPGALVLPPPPPPPQGQVRKRKVDQVAESTGSDKPSKKRNTTQSTPSFNTPGTPRPQATAPPSGVTQSRSEGFLLPPGPGTHKRLASELDENTVPCPTAKRRRTQHPNEQSNQTPESAPTDIPEDYHQRIRAYRSKHAVPHANIVLAFAKNLLKSCNYQGILTRQPTGQQASTDQASVDQASNKKDSNKKDSNKKDSKKKNSDKKDSNKASTNTGSTNQAPAEKMPTSQVPVGQPSQAHAMPAGNPVGNPSQGLLSAGQPLVNPHHDLEALGEFGDSEVSRRLKFGSVMIQRAGLGVPQGLPAPEAVRRLTTIKEELARQQNIAPILPPSELSPQLPKGFTPKPYQVPDDIDDRRVHEFFAQKNKDLCTRNKQVDLERNNMAAKGTRQRREESLSQYRNISKDLTIELNWWRLKAASLGADLQEWDRLSGHTRNSMNAEMDARMKRLEDEAAKKAKKEKSKAQSAINSQNSKLAKQDAQRQKKEIKQVISAFAAEDHAAIERMAKADYDASATVYRKPRGKQTSKKARNATNVDEDKDTNDGVETPSVETPADNATEDVARDPGNSENIDSNMFGLDDVARANTEFAPPDTSMTSQSVYAPVDAAQPSDFIYNPVSDFDSNVQAQGEQSSDADELNNIQQNDLRRIPSNINMLDAPAEATHMAPLPLMPTMMDQSAVWAPHPSFDSSTLPPTQFNPHLDGPMGDMNMSPANINGMNMVAGNNMDFNMHGHMNDLGTLPPYMNSDFQGPMNGIDASSPQNPDQPWYNPTSNAESYTYASNLPVDPHSNERAQQTTTDNTGTTDTFDINADPSTFPDPHDEIFFGNYLGDMNSSQN